VKISWPRTSYILRSFYKVEAWERKPIVEVQWKLREACTLLLSVPRIIDFCMYANLVSHGRKSRCVAHVTVNMIWRSCMRKYWRGEHANHFYPLTAVLNFRSMVLHSSTTAVKSTSFDIMGQSTTYQTSDSSIYLTDCLSLAFETML
jgi:hypothetical protein